MHRDILKAWRQPSELPWLSLLMWGAGIVLGATADLCARAAPAGPQPRCRIYSIGAMPASVGSRTICRW
jgi:hypothetical protein